MNKEFPMEMTRRDFLKTSAAAAAISTLPLGQTALAIGSDTIKLGLIGCGHRGSGAVVNACNADPGVMLVAMADLFTDRLKSSLNELKKAKPDQIAVKPDDQFVGFDGYKKVIEIADVVLIACASKFHPLYVKAAVEAGKHVFVEKPHAIDPHGIRELNSAIELAKQKNICIASGLQSRHDPAIQETIQRVLDGAIGEIVAIEENFLRAPYRTFARLPGQAEIQYQFYNWYHFGWLSGDDVTQSLVHNVDRATQVLRGQTPVKAHGLGGRASSFGEIYGDVFDHHSVIYEYASGVKMYAFCRTQVGCYDECSSIVLGTKGRANLSRHTIEGETNWRYKPTGHDNPYDIEHQKLFAAIRAGKQLADGDYMARSTQVAIMGQLACYSGKEILWEELCNSDFSFLPLTGDFTTEPPVKPDEQGIYPCIQPGQRSFEK